MEGENADFCPFGVARHPGLTPRHSGGDDDLPKEGTSGRLET